MRTDESSGANSGQCADIGCVDDEGDFIRLGKAMRKGRKRIEAHNTEALYPEIVSDCVSTARFLPTTILTSVLGSPETHSRLTTQPRKRGSAAEMFDSHSGSKPPLGSQKQRSGRRLGSKNKKGRKNNGSTAPDSRETVVASIRSDGQAVREDEVEDLNGTTNDGGKTSITCRPKDVGREENGGKGRGPTYKSDDVLR